MQNKNKLSRFQVLSAALCLVGVGVAGQAQAQLINFDFTFGGVDSYGTGAAAFGSASSQWNEADSSSPSSGGFLIDDTGATTSVSVSYSSSGSMVGGLTGAYAKLGVANAGTAPVVLTGLTPGGAYDLAIFSGWDGVPSFTVGTQTKSITPTSDWSTLTQGQNYVLFQSVVADGVGMIAFTPVANLSGAFYQSRWSGFQLQTAAVPIPAAAWLFGSALAGFGVFGRRKGKA